MNSSPLSKEQVEQEKIKEFGRVIARGIKEVKVEQQKNMAKAVKRRETMLEKAAEQALSGRGVQFGSRNK